MAGLALLLDLVKRNQGFSGASFHSFSLFSASAATITAIPFAARPFAPRLFGDGGIPIAYCDAVANWSEDYTSNLQAASNNTFQHDSITYGTKIYPIQPKPLLSAFEPKAFAITAMRSFILHYLPLLEPHRYTEEEDFLDISSEEPKDLVTPFKLSLNQIAREVTVTTVRRLLERLAIQYVSQRMAWKLIKDVSKSSKRKAQRGMPASLFVWRVSRTALRGHVLAIAATWIVNTIIEAYTCFMREDNGEAELRTEQKIRRFWRKVCGVTIRCGTSLLLASIGGGVGALVHPSFGQFLGLAIGDVAGNYVGVLIFDRLQRDL